MIKVNDIVMEDMKSFFPWLKKTILFSVLLEI